MIKMLNWYEVSIAPTNAGNHHFNYVRDLVVSDTHNYGDGNANPRHSLKEM